MKTVLALGFVLAGVYFIGGKNQNSKMAFILVGFGYGLGFYWGIL